MATDRSFRLRYRTSPDAPRAISRVLRRDRSLGERIVFFFLGFCGIAVGAILGVAILLLVVAVLGAAAFAIFGGPLMLLSERFGTSIEYYARFLIPMPVFTFCLVFVLRRLRRILQASALREEEEPMNVELDVDGKGIISRTDRSASIFAWNAVRRVEFDARYVFLFVSRRSALVVPRSAFADTADSEQLIELARKKREDSGLPAEFRCEWVSTDALS